MNRVYLVIVNWNGWEDTLECLESALRLDHPDYRILVCDNASSDDSVDRICEWAAGRSGPVVAQNPSLARLVQPNVRKPLEVAVLSRTEAEAADGPTPEARLVLIRTGANLGFAGGNNVALRHVLRRGDAAYVWLLNNDTVVEPDALNELVARAQAARDRGIVGSTLVFYGRSETLQAMGCASYSPTRALASPIGAWRNLQEVSASDIADVERDAAYVVGASMLVPMAFVREVGLMCEEYFLYFEELDWAIRGKALGYRNLYAPASHVYHKVGASTQKTQGASVSTSQQYSYRNRLVVTRRYFRSRLARVRIHLFFEGLRAVARGRRGAGWLAIRTAFGKSAL